MAASWLGCSGTDAATIKLVSRKISSTTVVAIEILAAKRASAPLSDMHHRWFPTGWDRLGGRFSGHGQNARLLVRRQSSERPSQRFELVGIRGHVEKLPRHGPKCHAGHGGSTTSPGNA